MSKSENNREAQSEALSKITKDRSRTNILRKYEQNFIAYLVQRVPSWMTSNMLTGIGFAGSAITAASFLMAAWFNRYWLLLGILGFAVNWVGDSLDGRLAYYRNKPRKWYGFSLDFTVDWLTIILIGYGYIVYVEPGWEMFGYVFVVLYGWAMMTSLLRYKIIGKYTIDSGLFGPTEARIILSTVWALEVIIPGSISILGALASLFLFIVNIVDFMKLLKYADQRDKDDKSASGAQKNS